MPKHMSDNKIIWLVAGIVTLFLAVVTFLKTAQSDGRSLTLTTDSLVTTHTPGGQSTTSTSNVSPNSIIGEKKSVVYEGVSFNVDSSYAADIKIEVKPALFLREKTDKPDSVAPDHLVFKIESRGTSQDESTFFSPEIAIFPIEEYKRALGKSKMYVRQFEDEVRQLRQMLSEQPAGLRGEAPFLPYGIDASQVFHARLKYISFQSGKGVMYLTQYNVEPALINNEGLTYTFQGLTNDGAYYVSATFPVTASFLPETYSAQSSEGYVLTAPESYEGREYELFERSYKDYLSNIVNKLASLQPDSFRPNLTVFEEMMQSLNIKPQRELSSDKKST